MRARSIIGSVGAEDRKLWTDHLAQVAVHALALFHHFGRMVTLSVEFLRHLKHILGAVLHAEPAPLAAVNDDMHDTVRYRELIKVQRFSPIFHGVKPHTPIELASPSDREAMVLISLAPDRSIPHLFRAFNIS